MNDKKKKILIFSTTYDPYLGGAEIALKEITDRIFDIEFDMITLRFDSNLPKFERIGNINVYRIGFSRKGIKMSDLINFPLKLNKLIFPFIAYKKAIALHRKNTYSGIWAMMAAYAGFSAMFFKKKNPNVPYLLTLQEGDPIDYIKKKVKFVYPLFKQIFTRADCLQVISKYLADFGKSMKFKGEPIVIPNAVNVKHFSQEYDQDELNSLKNELNKRIGDKFIITTSRLVKKNGIDDVIKSLKYLSNDVKFLILGDGPDKKKLQKLATEEKVEERVKFLGMINHEVMPKYLKISDVFIRPSLSEGMGNSFIEAMATKIPVIATPVGGIVDFLFDKEKNLNKKATGVFCKVHNSKNITKKIKLVLEDKELKNEIVKNAYEMVVQKYDWNIISKDMRELFKKLLK
ncbi:glycosyltransferase [Candidatus Parcubacteria bacterium]|nr:glycosyltransferase [Candidatus Parcubacteria bacterium]